MAGKATSVEDVMRGVAGGAILGVPLLYTQETWLHGRSVSPVVILAGVIVAFAANVALSYFVGFRPGHRALGLGTPACPRERPPALGHGADRITRRLILGGLINEYERAA